MIKTNKNGQPHLMMRLSAQNRVGLFVPIKINKV